jgi:hypothetical protein
VERLREKIHEVWGWCAPDDNPDDPVCRGKSCERGAKSLIAALSAGSAEPDEPEAAK